MILKRQINLLTTTLVVVLLTGLSTCLDLNCNSNQVLYWGQNSYGASHLNSPDLWEKDLRYYCDKDTVQVINLSFLNIFNAGVGLPEINFSNHCGDFFDSEEASNLHNCPKIGKDIKYCQSQGKTVLLSLGGAIARTELPSKRAASEFADILWNMFMAGTHRYRPFGDAIIDGIDLDLEGGSQANYDVFLSKLQQNFNSDSQARKYYVSAAPQCEFPDRNLNTIMEGSHIDFINVQFYNNWCGVQNYDNSWAFNFNTWDSWASSKSYNKRVKLLLGVPAAQSAAGSGYISVSSLKRIISDLRSKFNSFAGVMMWDASQSENNLIDGKSYGESIKDYLNSNSRCYNEKSDTPDNSTPVVSDNSNPGKSSSIKSEKCPINGQYCDSGETCNGKEFIICHSNRWLARRCPDGTICNKQNGQVYCDWPDDSKQVTTCT